jgi:AP endonuclease 1
LEQKKEWNVHFQNYIRDLDKIKPVIWTGDLNVAPTSMGQNVVDSDIASFDVIRISDLCNAKRNWNKSAGFTEAETTAFHCILEGPETAPQANKFVDIWRRLHPDERQYSYFSYKFSCRQKGIGWRLDICAFCVFPFFVPRLLRCLAVVLSDRIAERVRLCEIRSEIYGASDHCPVVMEIDSDVFNMTWK